MTKIELTEAVPASYHLHEITKLEAEVARLRAFVKWVQDHSNDPGVVLKATAILEETKP